MTRVVRISAPDAPVHAALTLPASKSISNRVLIVRALAGIPFAVENLSEAEDTVVLRSLLDNTAASLYCGEGGTTLRFLLAFLAVKGGEYTLTAAPSLQARPIAPLLNVLSQLGCGFRYHGEEGRLPVTLISTGLRCHNTIELPGDVSSQFISALMLAGPYIENGISIRITGEVLSFPYILMTARVMEAFGVVPEIGAGFVKVSPGQYHAATYTVEPDWSAASYWYEIAALRAGSQIFLKDLHLNSLQGDAAVANAMAKLGVVTSDDSDGIRITGNGNPVQGTLIQDLSGCPDTAPALIAACAGMNMTADFPGLKNFRLKETDRAAALQRELYNFGVNTDFCAGSKFKVYGGAGIRPNARVVSTYRDHRMAMAIAPLSLVAGTVTIDDPSVVSKSYPGYFKDLERAGFRIETA